jgi:hypothetical protein
MGIVVSYRFLRRAIGLIGSLLPIVLPLGYSISTGHYRLLASVSSYYYTDMRNVFVGSMCSVGVFLVCYRYRRWDDLLSNLAGALAIGVAMCPPVPPNPSGLASVVGDLHVVFAALFLVTIAAICWFLFPGSDRPETGQASRETVRSDVYRACAIVILAATALAGISALFSASFIRTYHPLFWCEAVATFAFGFAWWIKGETLIRDKPGTRGTGPDGTGTGLAGKIG